jgi:NDP-sugar pyrophosphorylase family protein
MQVVIPMSGIGKRFGDAGYKVPKPLIIVDGNPIISYVIDMFPGETNFVFICNREHLETTKLRSILEECKPGARIVPIEPHKKGPVYAVSQCFDLIDDEDEIVVNYCDFYSDWDYADFLKDTHERKAEGCVPSYRGFHPHMLGTDNYAFIKDEDRWLKAIQEKKPFSDDRMAEYASNGTYYFRHGRHVKKYFAELMEQDIQVNGEFYVSMVYNLLVRDGLPVSVYEVPHMLQWGTPNDLEEYQKWSDYFRCAVQQERNGSSSDVASDTKSGSSATTNDSKKSSSVTSGNHGKAGSDDTTPNETTVLIPMAGHGSRFSAAGYTTPKPLIEVSGKPMVVQATDALPPGARYVFVALEEHLKNSNIGKALAECYSGCSIVGLNHVTEGQACTCAVGVTDASPPIDLEKPLIIGACDNGMIYNRDAFKILTDAGVDAIAFTFRNHPASKRNPKAYGWIRVEIDEKAQGFIDGIGGHARRSVPDEKVQGGIIDGGGGMGRPEITGDGAEPLGSIDGIGGQARETGARVSGVSVKVPISESPGQDHAIVGSFYFRKAQFLLDGLKRLQEKNQRVNNEFYVDSLIGELAEMGLDCRVLEVDFYVCWGTPDDLKVFEYWQEFFNDCPWHPYRLELDPTVARAVSPVSATSGSTGGGAK